jgi:peptide/nickel transport system substrate-binding protein
MVMAIAPATRFTVVQATTPLADPHVLSDIRDRRSIIDAIYDGLVRRRDDGSFSPWLALDWQVEDGCRFWRFNLRPAVRFHDGSLLGSADVLASIERALSPELPGELGTQGVLRSYLQGVRLSAPDALTLEIRCETPLADLLDLLVDIPVVPVHALAGLPSIAIGSGPYCLEQAESRQLVLRAFPEHWAGRPPADQLVWLAEADPLARQRLFEAGQADLVVDPDRTLSGHPQATLLDADGFLCVIFMFNLLSGPCRDVRVRQALQYAIDRDALIADEAIAAGQALPLAGPLTPRHRSTPHDATPYPYDPAKARALLKEAGYAAGLKLKMDLPARFPDESIALSQSLAGYFSAVGVEVQMTVHHDRPAYAEMVRAKQFGDLCCFDSSPASDWRVFCEKLDARRQGPWWQGYESTALNSLLDQARGEDDDAVRFSLLQQAFTLVQQDAPWLFLYAPHSRWLLGPAAAGWTPGAEGRVRVVADNLIAE